MSDRYTELENAVVEAMQAAPALSAVKGWRTGVQDSLVSADAIQKGFRPEELPGVVVMAGILPSTSEPFTYGEIKHLIPVTVFLIGRAEKQAQVREMLFPLLAGIEAVFHQARTSSNVLVANGLVQGTVESSLDVVRAASHFYGIAEVTARVLKVEQL